MHLKSTNHNEIALYHNPDCSKAKKAFAYAKSLVGHVVEMEYSKTKKTATQWKEILMSLNKKPKDILDKSKTYYQENLKGRNFVDDDWLNVIINNPDLIRSPIAVKAGKAMLLDNPSDILHI